MNPEERYVHMTVTLGTLVGDDESFKGAVDRAERLYAAIQGQGFTVTNLDLKFVGEKVPR